MPTSFFRSDYFRAFIIIAVSFAVSFFLTPKAGKLARLCDCYDRPDGKRKLHSEPIPYFGGLAILLGFVLAAGAFAYGENGFIPRSIAVMILGGMAIAFVGVIDDMYDMAPLLKLFCQIAVSAFSAVFGGQIEHTTLGGGTVVLGWLSLPITVLWMVLIINAVNLIDGLDGLCGGVTALESFALLITAVVMGNGVCIIASAALCGVVLGFLPHNASRATIFMGDAGAMFIGYVMACISVFGLFKAQALFSIVVPALIFALPLLDTFVAFFRRVAKGQNPFKADHAHLHHKLMENGFTPKQSVIAIYCASAVFCIASILFMRFKLLSILLVLADLVFLELLKHAKRVFKREKDGKKETSLEG